MIFDLSTTKGLHWGKHGQYTTKQNETKKGVLVFACYQDWHSERKQANKKITNK